MTKPRQLAVNMTGMTGRRPPRRTVRGQPGFPKGALACGAQCLLSSDQLGGQDQDLSGSLMPVGAACLTLGLRKPEYKSCCCLSPLPSVFIFTTQ